MNLDQNFVDEIISVYEKLYYNQYSKADIQWEMYLSYKGMNLDDEPHIFWSIVRNDIQNETFDKKNLLLHVSKDKIIENENGSEVIPLLSTDLIVLDNEELFLKVIPVFIRDRLVPQTTLYPETITPVAYLAGPGVFKPDALSVLNTEKDLFISQSGINAVIPFDGNFTPTGNKHQDALTIRENNIEMIKNADYIVADMNPFRGEEPDSGTSFEVGYASSLGKTVILYLEDNKRSLREKAGKAKDVNGNEYEDFDLPLNLMFLAKENNVKIVSSLEEAAKVVRDIEANKSTSTHQTQSNEKSVNHTLTLINNKLEALTSLMNKYSHTPEPIKNAIIDLKGLVGNTLITLGNKISGRIKTENEISDIMKSCSLKSRFAGVKVNPWNISEKDFKPELFAESLARVHRFWAQTDLTVAEHCVNIAKMIEKKYPGNKELAQWGLFHELYESYTGDMATPYKKCLPEYKIHENQALAKFAKMVGVCEKEPYEVKLVDKTMMYTEALSYMPKEDADEWIEDAKKTGLKDFGFELEPYPVSSLREEPLDKKDAAILFARKWIELELPVTQELIKIAQRDSKVLGAYEYQNISTTDKIALLVKDMATDQSIKQEKTI